MIVGFVGLRVGLIEGLIDGSIEGSDDGVIVGVVEGDIVCILFQSRQVSTKVVFNGPYILNVSDASIT